MKANGKEEGEPLSTEEAVALIEAELLRATTQRMLEDREQFLQAHGPVDRGVVRSIIRRP